MFQKTALALALAAFTACAARAQTPPHAAPPEGFKYLPAKDVDALTDKPGAGAHTAYLGDHENYFVEYASRTDSGNVAEVHEHWTHYVHILSGHGTLVYGGTVVNAKNTGPGQVRGDAISGGTTLAVQEGDFVQIPAGMPHLFTPAAGTKLHYVVFNARQ